MIANCASKKIYIPCSNDICKTFIKLKVNNIILTAEVVDKLGTGTKGLSVYKFLPENSGMLFVYDIPVKAAFWNKNVSFALDIAFLDCSGTILEINELKPYDDETTIESNSNKVRYAIELNQGWFKKNNVVVGMKFCQCIKK
jgi:uncharacterized membrane protein (UPF0127 family)